MVISIQKIILSVACMTGLSVSTSTIHAASVQQCATAALLIGKKQVGQVSYFAESCKKAWDMQSIQMNFS